MSVPQSTSKALPIIIRQTNQNTKVSNNSEISLLKMNTSLERDTGLQAFSCDSGSKSGKSENDEEKEIYEIMYRHGVSKDEAKKIQKRKQEAKKHRPSGVYRDENGNPYGCDVGKSYKTKGGRQMTKQPDGTYKDDQGAVWQQSVYERKESKIQDIMEDLGVSHDEAERIYNQRREMDKQKPKDGVYRDENGDPYGCDVGKSYKTKSGSTMTKQPDGTYRKDGDNKTTYYPSVYEQKENEIREIMYDLGVSRERAEEIREQRRKQRKMGV